MKTLREYIDQLDEISRRDFLKGAGATAGLAAMGNVKGQVTPAPSNYAEKVQNKILPFIVFNPGSVKGNPEAVILVDLAPDGEILRTTILKSSGEQSWDTAVLTALRNAKTFPKDDNGIIPMRQMRLTFRPRDWNI
jgi:colicin import membrane protein